MKRRYIFLDAENMDYKAFKKSYQELYIKIYGLQGYAEGDIKIFRKNGSIIISVTPKHVYRAVAVSTLLSSKMGKKILFQGVYTTVKRGLRNLR
jgi:hypothetical protein